MASQDNTTKAFVSVKLSDGSLRRFTVASTPDDLIHAMSNLLVNGGFWSLRDIVGNWFIFNPAMIQDVLISPAEEDEL